MEHTEVKKINALVISMLPEVIHLSSDIVPGVGGCECASWTLRWKVATVNSLDPDIVIETHLNASKNPGARGCETLYYPVGDNEKVAKIIQFELVSKIGNYDRGVKARKDLFILRKTRCPTFIIEPLFLTSNDDRKLLTKPEVIAEGVVSSIKSIKRFL